MRISMNGTNAQAGIQAGKINKPMEMDSFSKSIQNQIFNAQKQLQELSENKDMSMEEKMKRRQEIQQQITELNNQLRQHQIEQRKEKQEQAAKSAEKKESVKNENKGAGLSQASMTAIISADAALSQAKVHGSVATRMEGRAGVLEAEIKQDGSRGGNVEANPLRDVEPFHTLHLERLHLESGHIGQDPHIGIAECEGTMTYGQCLDRIPEIHLLQRGALGE